MNPEADRFRFARALQLFPTVVFQQGVRDHEALATTLGEALDRLRAAEPDAPRPWQSRPDLHLDPTFAPLVDAVGAAVRLANHALRYEVAGFRLTGMWANHLRAGEHHPVHTHANNFWSGVFWVRVTGTGGRLTLLNPNPAARVLLPTRTEHTASNSQTWSLPPEAGTLVLFPSWLEHHVEPVRDGERLSVAFNVMVTGDLQRPDSLQWSSPA